MTSIAGPSPIWNNELLTISPGCGSQPRRTSVGGPRSASFIIWKRLGNRPLGLIDHDSYTARTWVERLRSDHSTGGVRYEWRYRSFGGCPLESAGPAADVRPHVADTAAAGDRQE